MEIIDETTYLDRIHKVFKKEDSQLSQNFASLLTHFKENSHYKYKLIPPKDENSSQTKQLLFSEYELWSYLETIYCTEQAFKAYNEPMNKKPEKFSFFQLFNPLISSIFKSQDLSELEAMKTTKDVYLERDLITDLSLISDILTYDEILWILYSLTQKIGAYDFVPLEADRESPSEKDLESRSSEKDLESDVQDYKQIIQAAEWDFLGVGNAEEYGKEDAKLFEDVYWMIRKKGVSKAQEALIRKNRFVLAALMNSGLAYHDFSAFDCDRYENVEEMRGVLVEEGLEFLANDWDKSIALRERRNLQGLKPLDFMLCKDFQEISSERRSFYLEKVFIFLLIFLQNNRKWNKRMSFIKESAGIKTGFILGAISFLSQKPAIFAMKKLSMAT